MRIIQDEHHSWAGVAQSSLSNLDRFQKHLRILVEKLFPTPNPSFAGGIWLASHCSVAPFMECAWMNDIFWFRHV